MACRGGMNSSPLDTHAVLSLGSPGSAGEEISAVSGIMQLQLLEKYSPGWY